MSLAPSQPSPSRAVSVRIKRERKGKKNYRKVKYNASNRTLMRGFLQVLIVDQLIPIAVPISSIVNVLLNVTFLLRLRRSATSDPLRVSLSAAPLRRFILPPSTLQRAHAKSHVVPASPVNGRSRDRSSQGIAPGIPNSCVGQAASLIKDIRLLFTRQAR